MSLLPKKKLTPLPDKQMLTSEKVTTSEEVDKGAKNLYGIKEVVVKIRRKYFDNFEGRY